MSDDDDLIAALNQSGITPTPEAIAKLDADITELAEFLIDYWAYEQSKKKDPKRVEGGPSPDLKKVDTIKTGSNPDI